MFQNILAILFILKLVKRSKFYAPRYNLFLYCISILNFVLKPINIKKNYYPLNFCVYEYIVRKYKIVGKFMIF